MWSNIEGIGEQIKIKFDNRKKDIVLEGKEEDHQRGVYLWQKDLTRNDSFNYIFITFFW